MNIAYQNQIGFFVWVHEIYHIRHQYYHTLCMHIDLRYINITGFFFARFDNRVEEKTYRLNRLLLLLASFLMILVVFLPILRWKYRRYWSYSTKLPIFDFCEIPELFNVKVDHVLGWTGRYTTVHQEFPRKFVSLIRIENRKKVSW